MMALRTTSNDGTPQHDHSTSHRNSQRFHLVGDVYIGAEVLKVAALVTAGILLLSQSWYVMG